MDCLNILHVVSIIAPRFGGAGITSQLMARYQSKMGHKVSICTTNVDYPKGILRTPTERPVFKDGVYVWHFSVSFRPLLMSISLWKWLRDKIFSFDIVHIHGLYRFPVTSAACLARRFGVPYVIMPHGSLDPFLYNQSQHNLILKRVYEHLFDFPNLKRSAAIQYTSAEEAKRAVLPKHHSKPVIIPNGIDWESYRTLPLKGRFRKRIGLNSQTPLVLFLGRVNFKKGLDLLIPAFGFVSQKHSDVRLAIVGPDNEGYGSKVWRWCRQQGIHDRVFFVGHLGQEKVKEAYVDADVFVLPSYTENFGLTVVEAMACGSPVVISDQVNIWREVQALKAGIVVGLYPRALADAICQVLSDKGAAKTMGTRGRLAVKKHFDLSRIIGQQIKMYQTLINQANRSNKSRFRKIIIN